MIVRNNTGSSGGGIAVSNGKLSVLIAEGTDNTATTNGGGILASGDMDIERLTLANNSAGSNGGGIALLPLGTGRTLAMSLSTISGNRAPTGAAMAASVPSGSTLSLLRLTVANNQTTSPSGNAILTTGGGAGSLVGTIVAGTAGLNCQLGSPFSGSGNLSDDVTCGVGTNSRTSTNPVLGALQANGGRTRTHALLPGSPAIDARAINAAGCSSGDQRTFGAVADGDEIGGIRCDIGAFEVQRLFVTADSPDFTDQVPGDNRCQGAAGTPGCSLRAAIQEANAQGHAAITLPPGTHTPSAGGQNENAAATGDLDVTAGLTLVGQNALATFIQTGTTTSNGIDRVFEIRPGAITRLNGVTIRHGRGSRPAVAS